MTRDTVKTLAGLVLIGIIVLATFVYGNSQRQAQLRHDQDVKQQQAKAGATVTAKPSTSAVPAATVAASSKPSANTAPVNTPTANTIQGSGAAKASPSVTPTPSASPSAGQVAGSAAVTPTTGGTTAAAPMPETGSPLIGMIGFSVVAAMMLFFRRSQRAILVAARARR